MKRLLTYLLAGLLMTSAHAQKEIVFKASVNRNKVPKNSRFKITFTINAKGSNFKPPSFNNFRILSGPNQSTSMRIVNGNVSRKIAYSYILTPTKKGKFTLSPAKITVNGNRLSSNKVTIMVTDAQQQNTTQQQQQQQQKQSIKEKIKNNLFLRAVVDKTEAYQGEAITVTYKLYSRVSLVQSVPKKMPSFTGFWTHELNQDKRPKRYQEVYKGKRYNVIPFKKVLLFPQKSGELQIDPLELKTVVRVKVKKQGGRRNLFNSFFFDRHKNFKTIIKSQPITIQVQPLPNTNQPESFDGAVGDLSFKATTDKTTTKINEPITLQLTISGEGNLKLLNAPELNLSPDIEAYDPEIKDRIDIAASGMSGQRTFEYLLIPRYNGQYQIPPVPFSYFDPETGQYVTHRTDSITIKVTGQTTSSQNGTGGKRSVKQVGRDILFIKTGPVDLREKGTYFFSSPSFFILLGSPLLLLLGLAVYKRREERLASDLTLLRKKRAKKLARKRLKIAQKHMQADEKEPFYEEVTKAIWGYLGDKLNLPASELTQEKARKILHEKGVEAATIDRLIQTIDDCEFARYGSGTDAVDMKPLYDQVSEVIVNIEHHIG